jgi:hypothetical protein
LSDPCPHCQEPTRVVTAVTVPALAPGTRRVLVTRQCTGRACQLKFPSFKAEVELTDDERAAWRRR